MNLERKDWILIQRYITGHASVSERERVNRWMNLDPENRRLIRELKEIWSVTPSEEFTLDVEKAWKTFQSGKKNSFLRQRDKNPRRVERKSSNIPVYLLSAAAILLVVLFAGYFAQYIHINDTEADQVSDFYVMQNLETGKGEKARITFSDGSKVILNSGSSLRFPEKFHGLKREVYLDGEAYFEVTHDTDQPFIVYNQNTEIEVLGTEFNVQGWSSDESVEVAVRDGKVSVGLTNSEVDEEESEHVILTKGLFTKVINGQEISPVREVNISNYLMWTDGGLYFYNTPFRKVIRDLERRFDVEISGADDKLLDVPYTGSFVYAELDEVLDVISASMGIVFQREGDKISIN